MCVIADVSEETSAEGNDGKGPVRDSTPWRFPSRRCHVCCGVERSMHAATEPGVDVQGGEVRCLVICGWHATFQESASVCVCLFA